MALPTDKEVFEALDGPADGTFHGKVFPVVQAVDEDKEVALPSIIYTPVGTEYDNYLDGHPNKVSASYRCQVFDKKREPLPSHEAEVLEALVAKFNVVDFRALEDNYVDEDGGIYVRTLQFVLGR